MSHADRTITAFDWVPDFAQGNVRDLRLRWALMEAGLPYEVELLAQGDQRKAPHIARQPFGQVPTMEIGDVCRFESGAIVWRIAEDTASLLPDDRHTRDRIFCWYFAALNTIEPDLVMLATLDFFIEDRGAVAKVRPAIITIIKQRLASLQEALADRDYLVGEFSAADLMMATVLRILKHTDIVSGFPDVERYLARTTDRPAFRKALDEQLTTFTQNAVRYAPAT